MALSTRSLSPVCRALAAAAVLLIGPGPLQAQAPAAEPPSPGFLLAPGLVPVGQLAESRRGSLGQAQPASPVVAAESPVADVVAAFSFVRVSAAERELQSLVARGVLARVVLRADSGSPGSAAEVWTHYVDGVRVLGASVRRVVASGRVADVQGFVPAPGSAVEALGGWPSGVSPAAAGEALSALLGGVAVYPESGPGGAPVRVWVPGFAVDVVRPAFVFVTADGRLFAADAESGAPLLEQIAISTFAPPPASAAGAEALFGSPAVGAVGAVGTGPAEPVAQGSVGAARGLSDRLPFGELEGLDLERARTLGSGSGLRLDPLLLNLLDRELLGLPGPPVLLDVFDRGTGYQATFDARRVGRSVQARCRFASRFFAPTDDARAYGRGAGARLSHLAVAPEGRLTGRVAEDRTVAEAHGLMTYARRYYRDIIDWRGIDNRGGAVPLLVNVLPYGAEADFECSWLRSFYSNAFFAYSGGPWGGGGFGFGTWQSTARSVATAVDVIGHEFVHAIAVHGRRNVFGSALGFAPQQVYVRGEAAPGRVTQTGSEIACGAPIDSVVLAAVRGLYEALRHFPPVPLFPFCTDVFPYQLLVGSVADASEGVSDIGGVGAEFALAAHGAIEPDYRMGEDLDGFGIRNLRTTDGGFRHFDELRRSLLVTRSPDSPCRGLVSIVTLHYLPPDASRELCALSPIGMFGSRPGNLDVRPPLPPHPVGVILGHAFYLAIEGGSGPRGVRTVRGAGRERMHDLVEAFLSVSAYTQPESFSLPAMAWAVLARIDERFGPHDPLWQSFAAAAYATGILFR